MHLVTEPITNHSLHLAVRSLRVDRQTLAKRRWRAQSEDGLDFGFDLAQPLEHGDCFFSNHSHLYRIAQNPEKVLAIKLAATLSAARVGWQIGNLHFPIAFEGDFMLAENDPAIRQLLAREQIAFEEKLEVFVPLSPAPTSEHHHHPHGHSH